jgi:septal ring factor EnvC (AmiA/AmiB activator)
MTVALGLAYLRRQIESDAASRLFLESFEVNRLPRKASSAVLLASVLKVNPRSAKAIAASFAGELKAFETEARRARHEEAMQREQSSQLQDEVRALQATCADLSMRLKVSESETSALKQQLADEDRLARDRQETIRARVSRTLKSDVALLHVGLEAIRRDPPRVGVMDDHADRVCESLRKELQQLELGGAP